MLKRQSIKTKILLFAIALTTIPIIIISILISRQTNAAAGAALTEQVQKQLISIREIKKRQIKNYFSLMERRLKSYAAESAVGLYLQRFNTAMQTDRRNLSEVGAQKTKLREFYKTEYANWYATKNAGPAPLNETMTEQLDNLAVVLQHGYLANNNAAFGEKHKLSNPGDGSAYSGIHQDAHKVLSALFEKSGASDLYLIDQKGNIVYSVQKYPDFATNLKQGPFAQSALAKLWQATTAGADSDKVWVSDIQPYAALADTPAMFMAIMVQDRSAEDAYELLGTLVFKIELTELDAIMSSDSQWETIGMGNTGDAYLVGADKTLRSNLRSVLQQKIPFAEHGGKLGQPPAVLHTVALQQNAVSRLALDNTAITEALAGKNGVATIHTPFGTQAITAYTSMQIGDLNWAVISEIDQTEALAVQTELAGKIQWTSFILMLITAAIASVVGMLLATRLTRPIIELNNFIQDVESSSDLTRRIDVASQDEIGKIAAAINAMLEKFRTSIEKVAVSTTLLATSADQMSAITQRTGRNVNQQFSEIDQIATAINQMSATVQEVARHAQDAANAAQTANQQSIAGKHTVEHTIDSMSDLSQEIEHTAEVIEKLNQESRKIGGVMDVIKGVAEQTNLLALNAAIEAARAGEQGRGFSVVADEVRTLASRTQQSTIEIEAMIQELQRGAADAVSVMQSGRDKSQQAVKQAAAAGTALVAITQSVNNINDMNTAIANAAEEQSAVTEEINNNITSIRVAAEETTSGAEQTTHASAELRKLAAELQRMVVQFKTA